MITLLAPSRSGQRVAGSDHARCRVNCAQSDMYRAARSTRHPALMHYTMPPRPRGARSALRVACQSRPEHASQPIYAAARNVGPQLLSNPAPEARLEAMRLDHTLDAYMHAERRLRGELSKRKELNTCVEAADSAALLLATVKVAETYPSVPNLRPLKRALNDRIEQLQGLANRARLELTLRA